MQTVIWFFKKRAVFSGGPNSRYGAQLLIIQQTTPMSKMRHGHPTNRSLEISLYISGRVSSFPWRLAVLTESASGVSASNVAPRHSRVPIQTLSLYAAASSQVQDLAHAYKTLADPFIASKAPVVKV